MMRKVHIKNILLVFVLAATLAVTPMLSACFGLFPLAGVTSISFLDDTIELEIGQSKEVTASMLSFEPRYATDKSFYLESSNESVVTVSGDRTLVGTGYGRATVTAVSNADERVRDTVKVDVSYVSDVSLSLSTFGGTRTDSGVIVASSVTREPIEFVCSLSVGADPETEVTWTVDGVPVDTGLSYVFETPADAGTYTVSCALADGTERTVPVQVYDAFLENPCGVSTGNLEQDDDYAAVVFTGSASLPEGNPEPVYDWYVDDAYSGSGRYAFLPPSPGVYVITLKVNGQPANIDGMASVSVRAVGEVTPTELTVEYDNCYPNVYISWAGPAVDLDYEVKIGGKAYRSTNSADRALFNGTTFDATGKLNIFADTAVSVRSLGDGDLFRESQTETSVHHDAVPNKAEQYLKKQFYDGARNYYIVDDAEFNEAYAQMILYRRGKTTVSMDVFIAYSPEMTGMEMASRASGMTHMTGIYYISADSDTVKADSVLHVSVNCSTVNSPSLYKGAGGSNRINAAMNALRPHVHNGAPRPTDYVFPIDRIAAGVHVVTGEELYYVAEKGFRPVPERGSAAESLYATARSALRSIVSDDMTDVEKAHAIYDYVMWKVVYDREVLNVSSTEESVKYAAYYLEGVFDAKASPFAVCDGIAKAYSLLCNIEGLPCVRISGTAGTDGSWGGHAWNKVCVDGLWYNVDATWGDYTASVGGGVYEMATHEYFLKTDAEFAVDHREDLPNDFPRSTDVVYNVYNTKVAYNGGSVDFYIMSTGNELRNELETLVEYVVATKPDERSFTVAGVVTVTNWYGIEIAVADTVNRNTVAGYVKTALARHFGVNGDFIATNAGGIIRVNLR